MLDSLRAVARFRSFERDRIERSLQRCANISDMRDIARRQLPGGVFDYIDGGAEDERALDNNVAGYQRLQLLPNVLTDVSDISVATSLLGRTRTTPIVLAPTGFTRIAHPEGELAVARAASRYNMPYALSTLGTRSIEELAAETTSPLWFQVYVWKDQALVRDLIARATNAGYEAIVVTVDTAVLGRRERDVRRGFTLPPKIGIDTIADGIRHPRWSIDLLRQPPITFANVAGHPEIDGTHAVSLSSYINEQFDQALSWQSLEWIRAETDLPIIVKGIQRVDDARRAAAAQVDAIVVSNHGGRQIDNGAAPIDLLPKVRAAVGDQISLICDGGVRRGSDVVKACALGADAVMVGRPYLYGLGAGGERGVSWVLDHLVEGTRRTMALCGRRTIAELGADLIGTCHV